MDHVAVVRTSPAETFELRRRVLRPHRTLAAMALAGDELPDTAHFCVIVEDRVVGTVNVRREAPPWDANRFPAWRLRGMATDPTWRRRGIGTALLNSVLDHVASEGGGLLWCNSRLEAVDLYRRGGLETRGDQWEDPELGPHVAMSRSVAGVGSPEDPGRRP